jgi:hypothetical protein
MRIAGMPLWALVIVACAVAPFVIRAWIDAEQRRARGRTVSLLESLGVRRADVDAHRRPTGSDASGEPGSGFAASTRESSSKPDDSPGGDGA